MSDCPKLHCDKPATHVWVVPTPFGTERQEHCVDHAYEEKEYYSKYSYVEAIKTRP